ncbi:hypothetical protein B0H13DRAFT_2656488 [Mycena leptocephala]|nr:hypothetical protein B0H13DRAFT_2656488 [Mycena leptocephala]
MSGNNRLPNELWLEIFSHLPRHSLKQCLAQISLTCRALRFVTRPLRFADFDWHPLLAHPTLYLMYLAPTPIVERALKRLKFWSSAEISSFVRTCHITPGTGDPGHMSHQYSRRLLDAIFERLPRFSGLRRIHAFRVEFSQKCVESLCSLPLLTHLDIDHCSVSSDARIDPSGLTLRITSFVYRDGRRFEDPSRWVLMLHPDHLCQFTAFPCGPLFDNIIDNVPRFPRVHKLSVGMSLETMSENCSILAKFPTVQSFSLEVMSGLPPSDAGSLSKMLPTLAEYTGSYDTLHMFLGRPALTRLTIKICRAEKLIDELKRVQSHNNVTSLDVTVFDFANDEFIMLLRLFPQLKELRISISLHWHLSATIMIQTLACNPSAVPSTLERLALSWNFTVPGTANYSPTIHSLQQIVLLRNTLTARCPGLAALWVDSDAIIFRWQKSEKDETVTERVARDAASARDIRDSEDFDEFWTGR